MINEFKTILQQFIGGKCTISEVTQQLEELLKKHPQLATPIDGQIKQLADSNKVTQDDYNTIHAITEAYIAAESGDKTMVSSEKTSTTAVTSMAGDKTEVEAGNGATDDDATEIGTDLPPESTQTSATQAGGDGFGLDLDNTTGPTSATATSPTIGPDGMPVMVHGDKVIGIGSILRNRFELKSKLGEGGMGAVYLAIDKIKQEAQDKNDKVAVKVLNETFKQFRESFIALQRESSKQQRLAHPNIATVFDFDRDYTYDTVFMTMEYMDGEPLDEYIKKHIPPEGLNYEEARPIIDGMCNGLAYAHHHNLVHSDFKPANTFVLKSGVVKLLDFGIARAAKPTLDADGKTETTLFDPGSLGALTPAYASAEMLEGETPEPPDDIYALACVTYQLLGGKHPFNKMPANQARDNKLKPAPIKKLKGRQMRGLLRGLEFDRTKRTQTVDQFLDEITPKKPIMLYAIAASVVILSIIGVLAQGQIKEYYRTERVNQMIASMGDAGKAGNYPVIAKSLKTIGTNTEDYNEQSVTQIKADKAVQSAIIGYYSARIDKQIDKEKGKYNYPAAYQILSEARGHYPDSGKIEAKQEEIDRKKTDELETQRDLYTRFLKIGPWLSTEGSDNDMPDVVEIIKTIKPKHELLTDPRLVGSYIKEAQGTRQEGKFKFTGQLIAQALIFSPGDAALINERDELAFSVFQAQNQETLQKLLEKVSRANTTKGLPQVLNVSKELAQIRLISPDNKLLGSIARSSTGALTKAIKAARDKTTVGNISDQFIALSPALSPRQQKSVQSALGQAWRRVGGMDSKVASQRDTQAKELGSQIASVSAKTEFTHEWTQSLKQLVLQLEGLLGSNHINTQKARRDLASLHIQQATAISEKQRLVESQIQLAYAKSFDTGAPGLSDAEKIISEALRKQEEERLEKERIATIFALKQDLLTKAKSEKIDDALKFLDLLKVYLLPDDTFLVTQGPNAIGRAYANIALRGKNRGDALRRDYIGQRDTYRSALEQVKRGFEIAPKSKDLFSARNQIQHALTVAKVRNTFRTSEKLDIAGLATQLTRIKNYNRDEYKRLQTEFSEVVAERIATMENYDPKAAKLFLDSAKQLPINQVLLSRIRIDVPVPSKYSKSIANAIKTSKLSVASSLLKTALAEESDHPDIKRLRSVLASKATAANTEFKKYKGSLRKANVEQAKIHLATARRIWVDNTEFNEAFKRINESVVKQYIATQALCTQRLAGFGRRSRGRCYDMVSLEDQGPIMVVVPAGAGHSLPFAVSKFEISVGDFNHYCKQTKKCPVGGANQKLPITGITLAQAKDYTAWLSKTTGQKYHLPNETEWLYAASAGGKQPRGKSYNCTLRLGNRIIKGAGLEDVNSGQQNGWGLANYIGNAQEWVESPSGIKVRGGAHTDTMLNCTIEMERSHDGKADKITSFRVIRDVT